MRIGTAERWLIIVGIFIIVSMLGALMQEQKRTIKVTLGVKQSELDSMQVKYFRKIDSEKELRKKFHKQSELVEVLVKLHKADSVYISVLTKKLRNK